MVKQAAQMQMELKRVQKQLGKMSVEFENAGVKVIARGDMTIERVEIAPSAMEGATAEKLGRQIVTAVNGALASAKKQAGAEMAKMSGGGGLASLLGGG